jgi:peptide/nickel transport system ATP-binding protein
LSETLLDISDLRTEFETDDGLSVPVDGISFEIPRGKTVGLVGESGCGKSLTALSVMRLVPPPGKTVSGRVALRGRDLLSLPEREMRGLRGRDISMIFQEPMTSLNPVIRIGVQVSEPIILHERVSGGEAKERTIEMLGKVGIPEPSRRFYDYPHQMSGGMRQRAMIAMALSCGPALLIADEPTTALDVTIQAQILELLGALQAEMGMSVLLITHDLSVVAQLADEVVVMYAGSIMERAHVEELYAKPLHPYTEGLFKSLPGFHARQEKLNVIRGQVPEPTDYPSGCKFRPRCPYAYERCVERPILLDGGDGHMAACWLIEDKDRRIEQEQRKDAE